MKCDNLKVAFAGTPEFAGVALDALLDSSHSVVGVLTQPDRPAGRGRKLMPSAVKARALEAGVPVQQPLSLKGTDAIEHFRAWNADVLVVAAYGLILPESVLSIPPMGCLNIHASLLPRWRGAAPIHRALLAKDEQTGVCIMQMDIGLDTGDILLEERCDIEADETCAQLHDRLALMGAKVLLEALPARCQGTLTARPQPEEGVTYAEKLTKAEARVSFNQSASHIHSQVRAYNPWPVAEAMLLGQRVRFWQSRLPSDSKVTDANAPPGSIVRADEQAVRVKTANGDIEFLALQWPGKKAQSAADFAQGKDLVGEMFTSDAV